MHWLTKAKTKSYFQFFRTFQLSSSLVFHLVKVHACSHVTQNHVSFLFSSNTTMFSFFTLCKIPINLVYSLNEALQQKYTKYITKFSYSIPNQKFIYQAL